MEAVPGTPGRPTTRTRSPKRGARSLFQGAIKSQNYDALAALVEATRADVEKAENGNKAACTRVRKAMQEMKNYAQEIRKEMLENRDAGK